MSGAHSVTVETEPSYVVRCGAGVTAEVAAAANPGALRDRVALVVDSVVWGLHGERFVGLADLPRLELAGGEDAKSFLRLSEVLEFLAAARCSRRSCLVAIGGGTVGDLAGFAASVFKRGMDVVQVPTTLLSQVDASVGGKTAINLAAGKNLAGTFHQPAAVFADTSLLSTLPEDEWRSGLGEVVKTALIGGEAALAELEAAGERVRDVDTLPGLVARAVRTKAEVVASDPTERGPRRSLNLGHTFGHAIEHVAGYGRIPHGVAVAAGIGMALEASEKTGVLLEPDLRPRFARLCRTLGLPASLAELREASNLMLDSEALLGGLAQDKKGSVGSPEFVLVRGAGDLALGISVPDTVLDSILA